MEIPGSPLSANSRKGVIADFDGDGIGDLAISNLFVSEDRQGGLGAFGAFGVLPGVGDGTFGPVVLTPVLPSGRFLGMTVSLGHADIDGDGNEDLVWTDAGSFIRVVLGNGNGTFAGEKRYGVGGSLGRDAQLLDINGDMKMDIAVGRNNGGTAVLLHR
jgi:hypothetical protein